MNASIKPDLLLIEDSPSFGAMLAEQLAQFGFRTLWRQGAQTLAEDLRSHPGIAAIICDVFLEDGSAKQHIEPLLELERGCPPIVYISAHLDFATRLEAVRGGSAGFFPKPLDIGTLVDYLDRLVRPVARVPLDVMVVDDARAMAEYHASLLQQAGMRVRTEINPFKVYDALLEQQPDLLVLDMHMPQCSGVELASVIRQDSRFFGLPIVFLSSERDVARQAGALRLGGDDFIVKPVDADFFVSSVAVRAGRYREMRERISQDSLTGLLNHTAIKSRLDHEINRARRIGGAVAFALIDIDRFKEVNDRHGHPVGDEVIRSLARLLNQRLRKSDIAGRYGGEEFAVILPDTDARHAAAVLDELRQSFRQIVQHPVGEGFHCTFSCGVASFPELPPEKLIALSDMALYEAKRLGRDRVKLVGGMPSGGA